jgi:5-methyltetrahydrofolate--homocysteine methyltransferase
MEAESMVDLAKIADGVIKADVDAVTEMVQQAIAEGQDVQKILNEGLIAGMSAVGDKFESGEFFLPEMIIASKTMKEGLELLRPLLQQAEVQSAGVIILGTAKGDIHDIGKGIVATMLEGGGFMVTDIGVDVDPDKFVEVAKEQNADIIGVSALLTTTMVGMKDVIDSVGEAGIKAKVMIGGASITTEYADEIGADGYAPDAPAAVKEAAGLIKQ